MACRIVTKQLAPEGALIVARNQRGNWPPVLIDALVGATGVRVERAVEILDAMVPA